MRLLIASVSMFTLSLATVSLRSADQLPQKFTNLKVLPADMAPRDLINVMKQFTSDLGVRCEHCHVGEGNDLSKFDFVSDARPAKVSARVMLKMVGDVNGALKALPAAPSQTVTCFTCHRGATKPAVRGTGAE
jgi:hypothetical protein